MFYRGEPIKITIFRRIVYDTLERAEDMLWTKLI